MHHREIVREALNIDKVALALKILSAVQPLFDAKVSPNGTS